MPSLSQSVRTRTLAVLLGVVATMLLGLGAWSYHLLGTSFERLEAAEAVEELVLARQTFAGRCDQLAASAVAWSRWSVGENSMEAREVPLPGDASLFLEVQLSTPPVLGRAALAGAVPVAHVPTLVALVAPIAVAQDVNASGRLLTQLDGKLMLVVWEHLLLADGTIGAVVAGRWLDESWITQFGEAIMHQTSIRPRSAMTLAAAEAQALDGKPGIALVTTDAEELIGHVRIDLPGGPLVATLSLDRGIVAAGGVTWGILMTAITVTGSILVVAVLLLLERTVLRRVTRLGQHLGEIGQTNDHVSLVDESGGDEIAGLGGEINRLLASQRGWREQISRRNAAMRLIFDTLPIGLLTLDPSGKIQPDRSSATAELLGRHDLDGVDLGELLVPGAGGAIMRRRLADHLQIVRSGSIDADEVEDVNPLKIVTVQRTNGPLVLRLRFYSIEHGSGTSRRFRREIGGLPESSGVLVTLSDISDERRLAEEVERSHSDYEQLKAMAEDLELFHGFLQRLRAMVKQLSDLSARMGSSPDHVQLTDLQRNVRALRAGGAIFGLAPLESSARSFDLELTRYVGMANLSDVEVRRCRYGVADMEAAVIAIERQFRALLGNEELAAVPQVTFGQRAPELTSREGLRVSKRAMLVQLAGLLVQPVRVGLAATTRMVVPMARRRGVDVRFTVQGEEVMVDQAHLEVLNHVLPHLLRFACDQGFDSAEDRAAANKPAAPMLTLAVERRDRALVLTVADDGGGIDPERMRSMAQEQGLMTAEAATELDDEGAQALVFNLNYDTGDQSLSGARPVGLNLIVKRLQDELDADVTVQSVPGQGTVVTISIPLSTL
jgi:Histidine kinase-, DNA gyrase B-, and HSP90-like ATPase